MKRHTAKIDVEVSVVQEQEPGLCYASVCELSKHRCRVCGAPIRRRGIRRVVLCPVCGTGNELK